MLVLAGDGETGSLLIFLLLLGVEGSSGDSEAPRLGARVRRGRADVAVAVVDVRAMVRVVRILVGGSSTAARMRLEGNNMSFCQLQVNSRQVDRELALEEGGYDDV